MDAFKVILDNKRYNIESFVKDHPGGVKTLTCYKGKSVLEAMAKFDHSSSAYHLLNDFKIDGDDDGEELTDVNLTGAVSGNGRIITKEESARDLKEIEFLEELENRLVWSLPLLSQLEKIAPHYQQWVNSAVYRKCRLFNSPILESMTYTPWYMVPAFWIPIILYLGWSQFTRHTLCQDACTSASLSTPGFLYHIIIGVILWTLVEYSLHRWVFHLNPGQSVRMIQMHFLLHGLHHKVPFDGLRQVFPPVPAMILALAIYAVVQYIFMYPLVKMTGGLVGYLTYDMIHYYVHHGSPAHGTYLYSMKRYHSNHHFINHDRAYGISNKMWDYVFNTFVKVRRLGFSLEW